MSLTGQLVCRAQLTRTTDVQSRVPEPRGLKRVMNRERVKAPRVRGGEGIKIVILK